LARVYFVLGGQSGNTSYIDTAFRLLEETLDVAPRDLVLLETLGDYYINIGEADSGTEMFTRCVEVNPNYVPCLSRLGGLQYHYAANYALAIQYLSEATKLGSTAPEDWYLLGRAYARLSQCNLADEPLREGYRLRQEIETDRVGLDDFITAFRQCGLSEPSQSTTTDTDTPIDVQSDTGTETETENLPAS
jgi:tetratricopeptide (TPR) repeat protein